MALAIHQRESFQKKEENCPKNYSKMFIIVMVREMQIKATLIFHFTPNRMIKISKTNGNNNAEGDEEKWKLHSLLEL